MKKLIIIILLLIPCYAQAEPFYSHKGENRWTRGDTARELLSVQLSLFDLWQTRYIARHPDKYYETNKFLGKHPSIEEVNRYFLALTLTHAAISYALPRKYRTPWQYVTIGMQINTVQMNNAIGIKFEF